MGGVQPYLAGLLLVFGAGFLIANARLILEYVRFLRRRPGALLIWPSPKPPYYGLALAIGVVLGFLVFYKLVVLHRQVFGEGMMFLYYAYLLPLSLRPSEQTRRKRAILRRGPRFAISAITSCWKKSPAAAWGSFTKRAKSA